MLQRHEVSMRFCFRRVFELRGSNNLHRKLCPEIQPVFLDMRWLCPWLRVGQERREFWGGGWGWRVPYCWRRKTLVTGDLSIFWWGSHYHCPFVLWFRQCKGWVNRGFCYVRGRMRWRVFYRQHWVWGRRCRFWVTRCKRCNLLPGCRQDSFEIKLYLKFEIIFGKFIISNHLSSEKIIPSFISQINSVIIHQFFNKSL